MMTGLLMIPTALLLALWGRVAFRLAAGPERGPDLSTAGLSALTGYGGVLIAIRSGPGVGSVETELALCVFGALLLLVAWIDQRTAWAPDGITLPLMFGGAASAGLIGSVGIGPISAIGVAFGIFIAAQVFWAAQAISGFRLLPPADLMALSLPILLFGPSPYAPLTYLLLSALLLIALRGPEPVYRLIRGPAAEAAVRDAGLSGAGRSAPLLPMALGSLFMALLLRLTQG